MKLWCGFLDLELLRAFAALSGVVVVGTSLRRQAAFDEEEGTVDGWEFEAGKQDAKRLLKEMEGVVFELEE